MGIKKLILTTYLPSKLDEFLEIVKVPSAYQIISISKSDENALIREVEVTSPFVDVSNFIILYSATYLPFGIATEDRKMKYTPIGIKVTETGSVPIRNNSYISV
jgi:hypothetical protein